MTSEPIALGGKPNPGTPADKRLKENRRKTSPPKAAPKPSGKK